MIDWKGVVLAAAAVMIVLFPVLVVECWFKAREIRRLRSLPSVDAGEVARAVAEALKPSEEEEYPPCQNCYVVWEDRPLKEVARRRMRTRRRQRHGIHDSERASVGKQPREAAEVSTAV